MFKKSILFVIAFVMAASVHAASWTSSPTDQPDMRLYSSTQDEKVVGMFCRTKEKSCSFFVIDPKCTEGTRGQILANSREKAGMIPTLCLKFDALPNQKAQMLMIADAFKNQVKKQSNVSVAVVDEITEEIRVSVFPFDKLTFEQVKEIYGGGI